MASPFLSGARPQSITSAFLTRRSGSNDHSMPEDLAAATPPDREEHPARSLFGSIAHALDSNNFEPGLYHAAPSFGHHFVARQDQALEQVKTAAAKASQFET